MSHKTASDFTILRPPYQPHPAHACIHNSSHPVMYASVLQHGPLVIPHSSFVRSSAQYPPSPEQYSDHAPEYGFVMDNTHHDSPASSNTSSPDSTVFPHVLDLQEQNYDLGVAQQALNYPYEQYQRPLSPNPEEQTYHDYMPSVGRAVVGGDGRYLDTTLYDMGYFDGSMPNGSQQSQSQADRPTTYTTQTISPTLASGSATLAGGAPDTVLDRLQTSDLQYPDMSPHAVPAQMVVMHQPLPSPTISPHQIYSPLPTHNNHNPEGSPNGHAETQTSYTATPSPALPHAAGTYYGGEGQLEAQALSAQNVLGSGIGNARKRQRVDESPERAESSSSESEDASEDEGDNIRDADYGDDGGYETDENRRQTNAGGRVLRRRVSQRQRVVPSARSAVSHSPGLETRLTLPVPVPNLTKKSRGRRVPTDADAGIEKSNRGYVCQVDGCNKRFQRGEHLKRHILSIHTNEKPYKCPSKTCGKTFSRHDNLRQHMRVHKKERL